MGFFDSALSIATGGAWDAVKAIDNVIDHSDSRDWTKLFTGGLSELYTGVKEGDVWGGFLRSVGGVIDNPLINASDDYLTRTGTINQRLLNDAGWMSDKVYQKNYDYTSGLIKSPSAPDYITPDTPSQTPSFAKTELPKLTDYGDSKDKKIAEALTDEYKNYKLNDYMLYKQDPEKLQDLILRYT